MRVVVIASLAAALDITVATHAVRAAQPVHEVSVVAKNFGVASGKPQLRTDIQGEVFDQSLSRGRGDKIAVREGESLVEPVSGPIEV